MKKFMKVVALALLAAMLLSLAACGPKVESSSTAYVDSSETQQRWLRRPDSAIVINPDFVAGDSSSSEKQALNLGFVDESGNVTDTFDDLLFVLEDRSSNGVGGTEYWSADFSDAAQMWMNMDRLDANNSRNDALDVVVNADDHPRLQQAYPEEFNLDENNLTLVVDVAQCDGPVAIRLRPTGGANERELGRITAPGTYVYNMRKAVSGGTTQTTQYGTRGLSFDFDFLNGGVYKFNSFKLMNLDTGVQKSEADVTSVWAPYSITSNLAFPNGTAVKTEDFFYGENTVNRVITCTESGIIALAGKIYGAASFDASENVVTLDTPNGKIAILSKRKGDFYFYKTEEEMLSGANGSDDPEGALYWVMEIGEIAKGDDEGNAGDSFYVSVSMDKQMSTDDLAKLSYDGVSSKGERVYNSLIDYWTEQLGRDDIASYITAIGN